MNDIAAESSALLLRWLCCWSYFGKSKELVVLGLCHHVYAILKFVSTFSTDDISKQPCKLNEYPNAYFKRKLPSTFSATVPALGKTTNRNPLRDQTQTPNNLLETECGPWQWCGRSTSLPWPDTFFLPFVVKCVCEESLRISVEWVLHWLNW